MHDDVHSILTDRMQISESIQLKKISIIDNRSYNMPVMSSENEPSAITMAAIKHEQVNGGNSGVASVASDNPPTVCGGCGLKITDRFYLVAVERAWHSDCLRCSECRRPLDTALSCFARQSRIYCRDDYYRSVIIIPLYCISLSGPGFICIHRIYRP